MAAPVREVWRMPSRSEIIERLRGMAERMRGDARDRRLPHDDLIWQFTDDVFTAVDLLEAGESRTEYRVVGCSEKATPVRDFEFALAHAAHRRTHGDEADARVQQRTITESPWTDVSEDE